MFQVEASKVLQATGASWDLEKRARLSQLMKKNDEVVKELPNLARRLDAKQKGITASAAAKKAAMQATETVSAAGSAAESSLTVKTEAKPAEAESADGEAAATEAAEEEPLTPEGEVLLQKAQLENALMEAKILVRTKHEDPDPQWVSTRLRSFRHRLSQALPTIKPQTMAVDEMMSELQKNMEKLEMIHTGSKLKGKELEFSQWLKMEVLHPAIMQHLNRFNKVQMPNKDDYLETVGYDHLSKKELRELSRKMKADAGNPVDETKPYATPWRPRPFMKPFAFIPRYLEVNHNICAAIYMRHPVVRKGSAEVPTPFGFVTNQLAHNWYVERS